MDALKNTILRYNRDDITNGDQVIVPLGELELWFTQIHFVEIQELIRLTDETKDFDKTTISKQKEINEDEEEKSGLSIYEECVGKTIRRKSDGITGIIKKVSIDEELFYVEITKSRFPGKVGQTLRIVMSSALSDLYVIE